MKKLLLLFSFLMLVGITYANDVMKMQGISYAYQTTDSYGNWTEWSEWQDCSVLIVINTNNDRINIYSNTPQEYDIYDFKEEESDGNGGSVVTFNCIDKEGLRCDIRIRVLENKSVQLYVDYSDVMFVYAVQFK